MFCEKCGKENAEAARFCAGCGAAMSEENTQNVNPVNNQPVNTMNYNYFVPNQGIQQNTLYKKPGSNYRILVYVIVALSVISIILPFINWIDIPVAQYANSKMSNSDRATASVIYGGAGLVPDGLSVFGLASLASNVNQYISSNFTNQIDKLYSSYGSHSYSDYSKYNNAMESLNLWNVFYYALIAIVALMIIAMVLYVIFGILGLINQQKINATIFSIIASVIMLITSLAFVIMVNVILSNVSGLSGGIGNYAVSQFIRLNAFPWIAIIVAITNIICSGVATSLRKKERAVPVALYR